MKTTIAAATGLVAVLATPVYAFQCPVAVYQIDVALQAETSLGAEQLAEVKKLRDEGEQLHKAGKHGDAVAILAKAKELFSI